jgi:hypothetical protein
MSIHFGQLDKKSITYSTHNAAMNSPQQKANAQSMRAKGVPVSRLEGFITSAFEGENLNTFVRIKPKKGLLHRGGNQAETTIDVKGQGRNIFAQSSDGQPAPVVSVLIDTRQGRLQYDAPADQLDTSAELDTLPKDVQEEVRDGLALHQEMVRHFDVQA